MLCVCAGDVMDVAFSVCIVRCGGAVGARVCLCLVCIRWQFSMLPSA